MTEQTCCRPRFLATPGGLKLSHSRYCPEHPGERISRTIDPQEIEHQERMAEVFRRKPRVIESSTQHIGRVQTWRGHAPACRCNDCAWVDGQLDRDDG